MKLIAEGGSAQVYLTENNLVLRVSREKPFLRQHKLIVPLLDYEERRSMYYTLHPLLTKKLVSQKTIDFITVSLAKDGIGFWDTKPENVMYYKLLPVVCDLDALMQLHLH